MDMAAPINETVDAVQQMQDFDAESLRRADDFGESLSFADAVPSAESLVKLYKHLPLETLQELPIDDLQKIRERASNDFSRFDEILKFDPQMENALTMRQKYIDRVTELYHGTFSQLRPYISYCHAVSDTGQSEQEALVKTFEHLIDEGRKRLEAIDIEGNRILEAARLVAADRGVSAQAAHFDEEATGHRKRARQWQCTTFMMALIVTAYAFSTLYLHKLPGLSPPKSLSQTAGEEANETSRTSDQAFSQGFISLQLIASKLLIFGVLTYVLFLSAKSFLSHKHNEIVNKHRQNALMTFEALVNASGTTDGKETILTHASACIFAPQDTGYVRQNSDSGSSSIVELLPKAMIRLDGSSQ
jgi:hypothetical protein